MAKAETRGHHIAGEKQRRVGPLKASEPRACSMGERQTCASEDAGLPDLRANDNRPVNVGEEFERPQKATML